MYGPPICCPPKQIVNDYYVPRVVPVIYPIEIVNRQHIVNIPRPIYQPYVRNEVVDPGYPNKCC